MMTHRTFIQLYPAHVLDTSNEYRYGVVDTLHGPALIISKAGFLLALGFTDDLALIKMNSRQKESWIQDSALADDIWQNIKEQQPVKAVLQGTDFQLSVWNALLDLQHNQVVTYKDIAHRVGKPNAVRAVANAIGANPIALLVPCHLVIGSDGGMHGYRWGVHIKEAMLGRKSHGHI